MEKTIAGFNRALLYYSSPSKSKHSRRKQIGSMKAVRALLLSLVLVAALTLPAAAKDIPVAWRVTIYAPIEAAVGDTVTFTWQGRHGVASIPSGSCPASFANNAEVTVLAPESRGGTYVWTATAPGEVSKRSARLVRSSVAVSLVLTTPLLSRSSGSPARPATTALRDKS